jgi:hypothetical protein
MRTHQVNTLLEPSTPSPKSSGYIDRQLSLLCDDSFAHDFPQSYTISVSFLWSYIQYVLLVVLFLTEGIRCIASQVQLVKCTGVYNVLYEGRSFTVDLCLARLWAGWNHVEKRCVPPPPKPLTLSYSGHYRFSLLAALQRDKPGWSTARELASSQVCDQWMQAVYINIVIHFLSSNTFSWNTPRTFYLLSIDCYYLLGWLTTNWNKGFHVRSPHFPGCCREQVLLLYCTRWQNSDRVILKKAIKRHR